MTSAAPGPRVMDGVVLGGAAPGYLKTKVAGQEMRGRSIAFPPAYVYRKGWLEPEIVTRCIAECRPL